MSYTQLVFKLSFEIIVEEVWRDNTT